MKSVEEQELSFGSLRGQHFEFYCNRMISNGRINDTDNKSILFLPALIITKKKKVKILDTSI